MFKKGLALRQTLASRAPGDAGRQMDLAQAWQYAAWAETVVGRHAEAASALAEQAKILEEQRRLRPSDRNVRRSLGQNLYLRGESSKDSDAAGALAKFREAERIEEELVTEEPTSVQFRRDLAYTQTEVGNTELELGNASAALEEYRRTLAAYEAMAKDDPKNTDSILGIAMGHHNSAAALKTLGRRPDALAEFRLARTGYETVVAASPTGPWVSGMLGGVYVQIADFEYAEDPESACGLYGKAVGLFDSVPGSASSPENKAHLARAGSRLAACRSRP
jgi:tetratricopeptide (TPR) repeat protein